MIFEEKYQYLLGKVSTESFMDGDPYRIVYQYLLGKVSTPESPDGGLKQNRINIY